MSFQTFNLELKNQFQTSVLISLFQRVFVCLFGDFICLFLYSSLFFPFPPLHHFPLLSTVIFYVPSTELSWV